MAYIPPVDKLLHFALGALAALAALVFAGWPAAVGACAAAAAGREVYGRWRRAVPMTRYDWIESAQDAAATLAGGAVVLAAAAVGL